MISFKILTLSMGKKFLDNTWNFLVFKRRTFINDDGDISVPSDKVLQMHSPKMDCELIVDGEVYIL